MTKLLDTLKFLLGWPLSLAALFFIGRLIYNQSGSLSSIESINPSLLIGSIFCFIGYFWIRSYVWHFLLKEKGYSLQLPEVVYLWQMSEMRRFVPGNIWSFLSRSFLFTNVGVDKKTLWFLMLTEIQFFLLGCCILSLLALPPATPEFLKNIIIWVTIAVSIIFTFHKHIFTFFNINKFTSFFPLLSPSTMVFLLLLSIFYMFLYGLGSYLSISSLVYLNPVYILSFIGLFVLSLLIGYLSIITPMGLGVREGIITSSLHPLIGLSFAALGALFSRVILIVAELLFFLFTFIWRRRMFNFIQHYSHLFILLLMITVYCVYFTSITFLRQDHFYTGRFDLGNMDQTVWNSLHGNFFEFTNPNGIDLMSRLGFHADFILVFISPFYLLWSSPKMLLLLQTVILSTGAIFVYLIAKNVLKKKTLALLLSGLYLLNPSLQYTNIYDFHAVTFATTFLLAAFYFMYKKQYAFFIFFLLLACFSKEQIWIVGIFFGLYLFIIEKKRALGLLIAGLCGAVFYYLMTYAIPHARGASHFALSYYSEFGDSPSDIIKSVIFSPVNTLATIFTEDKIGYLYQLLMPLGLLSLIAPYFLVFASADFAISLLSNNPQLHQIYYQYTAVMTPFLFISAIYGIRNVQYIYPKTPTALIGIYLLFSSLLIAYKFGPLPGAKSPNLDMITKQKPYAKEITSYLQSIPSNKKVSTMNNIGAHVSQRQYLYTLPLGMNEADVLIFNLDDPYSLPSPEIQKKLMRDLQSSKKHKLVFQVGDIYAFEKAYE